MALGDPLHLLAVPGGSRRLLAALVALVGISDPLRLLAAFCRESYCVICAQVLCSYLH